MKRKIFTLIFIITLFLCSFNVVKATDISKFKKGDLIEVELNKNLKGKFYVISDSDSDNMLVEAVYDGVLGEEFSYVPTSDKFDSMSNTAYNKLNTLTKDWITAVEIRLLNANEIYPEVDLTTNVDYDFTEPNYLNIKKNYWTQSIVSKDENFMPVLVTNWNTYSNLHTTVKDSPANKGAIRPVIKVPKTYIDNGMINKPKTWNEYVQGIQQFIILYLNDPDYSVEITHTEKTMDVSVLYNEETVKASFKYENGVLISDNEKNNGELLELIALYNIYQNKELIYLVNENDIIGVDTDYYKFKENKADNDETVYYMEIDLNHYFGLLDNEKKALEEANKDKNVKNPKTVDINVAYTIGILMIAGMIMFIAAKKLKKIK